MCGICGILIKNGKGSVNNATIISMRDNLTHRGPDDSGIYNNGQIGLGHRRLSIIDLEGNYQPISNENYTIWSIFNGEIYNYLSLRSYLIKKGHAFKTKGDSEVIVHLYEEYGPDFVNLINGMFAIALWDNNKKKLYLFRDRIGIKPLYYIDGYNFFAFASEIKALLLDPHYIPQINEKVIYSFFYYGELFGKHTLFKDIYTIEPGHYIVVSNKQMSISKYWDLSNYHTKNNFSEDYYIEQLDTFIKKSVELRLMSEVDLGAFLSGGIDSSLIVSYMNDLSSKSIKTFSIGFKEKSANEFQYSRWVAKHYETDHHEYLMEESEFLESLPNIIWHQDEPIRHHASVPLYFLSKYTKNRATVILSGEGADEIFLGYRKFNLIKIQNFINNYFQKLFPRKFYNIISLLGPTITSKKIGSKQLHRINLNPVEVALSYGTMIPEFIIPKVLKHNWYDQTNYRYFMDLFDKTPIEGFINKLSYLELKTYLISLLMKQDKMSMGASIETRVPFLDHELVEFVFSIPEKLKLKSFTKKYILKKLAERKINNKKFIYRKKMGFPVPLTQWLTNGRFKNYLKEILLDNRTLKRGIINTSFIEKHIKNIEKGIWGTGSDASDLLWRMLNFELWCRIFIDHDPKYTLK